LSKGEIIEQGTHDELLARNGMYANLVNAQQISSSADEEKKEIELEQEDLEEANKPLDVLQRTATQGSIEEKEPEPPNYSNYQLVKKALLSVHRSNLRRYCGIKESTSGWDWDGHVQF
jgi:ATP-binding cassette, subfamily B (MDR/TAP), member 1